MTNPTTDQQITALYLWVAEQFQHDPLPERVLISATHVEAIDAALTELFASRKKLSRKGKGGRPAVCRCMHKRHAGQCPGCGCPEYVAEPMSGNAARKRARAKKKGLAPV